jgi:hypothetical protein
MELLRVSPYTTTTVDVEVPSGYDDEAFTINIIDMADLSLTTSTTTASTGDTISVSLSARYDSDYDVVIMDSQDDIVHTELYEVRRAYTDPNSLGETATEISKFVKYEEMSRAVIDSIIPQGFYYKKQTLEISGMGSDYLPLWVDAKKILKVYENNVLVYDVSDPDSYTRSFEITKDKTAIVESYEDRINRAEGKPLYMPTASSDLLDTKLAYRGFPENYDYRIVIEAGHVRVPSDIKRATELLIEDIDCGKLDYYKRYMASYSTDQFKIGFDSRVFEGTGNIIVDKILSKYAKSIVRPGVL